MREPVARVERKTKLGAGTHEPSRGRPGGSAKPGDDQNAGNDTAAYLLDVLMSARQLAAAQGFRFLAYLLGMAIEETRNLAQDGGSWATQWRDRTSRDDAPRE